ncbi:monovalent cation:proton antiporter-2 (CPA2) family protein [Bdellovibrio sp. HCB2-146]|uniref:monovalent cation:proton antiporter-2 (CPA2) family protein n=1 Tax=Bdellovibrio sp. HCB2-146 TaxID=3394362 RepID=UPI0039BD184D
MIHPHLFQVLAFLGSSILLVSVCQKLGLGSILGYLAAGILIGPQGLGMILDYRYTQNFAEFGVVFLLFMIGLELQPRKLWALRRTLIGFGGLQVLLCTAAFALIARGFDLSWPSSFVIGFALSLSSTAFAVQSLSERKVLNTEFGRSSFAILLMQDVFAIPALAIIPTLGLKTTATAATHTNWAGAVAIIIGLAIFSKTLMGPFLRQVASFRSRELFTGVTLFIVIGVAYSMEEVGLSMALGAFLGGVFLSESEYRHELEADLDPFKGILMGLFFVSVGMGLNLDLLIRQPLLVLGATIGYMIVKSALLFAVGRIMRLASDPSRNLAAYISQGGEFAFVLFGVGLTSRILPAETTQFLTMVVTLSMVLSPFIIVANDKFDAYLSRKRQRTAEYDSFEDANNKIVIAGFGRFGQIFGRLLRAQNIGFTAIDHDSEQIELLRRFGNKVYYGDASRKEILEAAGMKDAKHFILAVDDMETATSIARTVRANFPHVKIYARARNRQHTFDLMDLGVTHIRRETLDSSLTLTQELLVELGHPQARAHSIIERFRKHDELMLAEQYKVRHDQKDFINVSRLGTQQLAQVLKEDLEKTYIDTKDLQQ